MRIVRGRCTPPSSASLHSTHPRDREIKKNPRKISEIGVLGFNAATCTDSLHDRWELPA
jgi:hypothetical protein